jgi:ABC-2 type transport system permease protein
MKSFRRFVRGQIEEEGDVLLLTESAAPHVREFDSVNWLGLWTLTKKESMRFLTIPMQTIIAPITMALIFYAVSALGFGQGHKIGAVPFLKFLAPGLIMMTVAQCAFSNTSISLLLSKIQGNIIDVLMPPLSPLELTMGYAFAGVVRGILVGGVCIAVFALVTPLDILHVWSVLYFAVVGSLMLSLIGLITGIWSEKFEHLESVQNFLIMPATFLSGVFFSVASLPEKGRIVCFVNPFYYMIDGFRYGFTGYVDSHLLSGMALLLIFTLGLFHIAYWMFAHGTRLKT